MDGGGRSAPVYSRENARQEVWSGLEEVRSASRDRTWSPDDRRGGDRVPKKETISSGLFSEGEGRARSRTPSAVRNEMYESQYRYDGPTATVQVPDLITVIGEYSGSKSGGVF